MEQVLPLVLVLATLMLHTNDCIYYSKQKHGVKNVECVNGSPVTSKCISILRLM